MLLSEGTNVMFLGLEERKFEKVSAAFADYDLKQGLTIVHLFLPDYDE